MGVENVMTGDSSAGFTIASCRCGGVYIICHVDTVYYIVNDMNVICDVHLCFDADHLGLLLPQ